MLRLTLWAQARPTKARFLLIILHILLVMVAIRLGLALDLAGVSISVIGPLLAAAVILLGFMAYPYGKPIARATWRRRKTAEATILTGAVVAIALLAVQLVSAPIAAIPTTTTAPSAHFTSLTHPDATLDAATVERKGRDKRLWRRAMRAKVKDYLRGQQRKIDNWGAAALITLSVLLAVFLEMLILALACSISCNGAEGLAVVVGVLGTAGVIILAVVGIGAILRAKRRSENPDDPEFKRKRSPRTKVLE